MNPDQDDSAGTEDKGPGETAPDHTEPDAQGKKTKSKAAGWWRRRRADQETQPPVSRCVVIGPTAAGKTQLLSSLRRCITAESHSYAHRYIATFGNTNDKFDQIDEKIEAAYSNGLKLEATPEGECFVPRFTLRLTSETGWPRRTYDTTFETFEGAGGLLEKPASRQVNDDAGFRDCRQKLEKTLFNCETVLICLPIVGFVNHVQEQALNDFIDNFLSHRKIRSLVVCLTMYEKLGLVHGRNAYRNLATPTAARTAMRDALDRQLRRLDNALRQFSKRSKRQVWCVPVSSYGFVPYNGGANLSLLRDMAGNQDDALRTIPTPTDSNLRRHLPERPYSKEQAYRTYWRPFLTIDPFMFIATGDRTGTLIHHYRELR